jgi:hypothetical protein
LDEVKRIVAQIRERWAKVKIVLRADSGFARDALMTWCEKNHVAYVFGLARNSRLEGMVKKTMDRVQAKSEKTGEPVRQFRELRYRTLDSWSRLRRVVAKVEYLPDKPNPRFVVTSLGNDRFDAATLYEDLYCARGNMENRIKEQQLDLFADRTSAHTMRANQLRLWLASLAYVLIQALRRFGLEGTQLERAQAGTIRTRLLKIGAVITVSVRRVFVAFSEATPMRYLMARILSLLRKRLPALT